LSSLPDSACPVAKAPNIYSKGKLPAAETAWEVMLLSLFFPALHLQRFFGSFDFRLFFAAAAALAENDSFPNNL
jgi:hypothetical protein